MKGCRSSTPCGTAYPEFRKGMYVTSYLWAALFLVQAAVTALIIRRAAYATAYNYDQSCPSLRSRWASSDR